METIGLLQHPTISSWKLFRTAAPEKLWRISNSCTSSGQDISLLSAAMQTKASAHRTFQANGPMLCGIGILPKPLTFTLDCTDSREGFEYTVCGLSRNATFGGWEYGQATTSR